MYTNILVATDGSATAQRAVRMGVGIAGALGAKITVLHVGDAFEGETVLSKVRDEHGDVRTLTVSGDPADKILEVAESDRSDLIVIGNKGMSGAKRFLLGSVPNKVSHHAPCNVLIVKTT
ncbi:MAG: universal stress protein [Actinomycetota bacterium]